MALLALDNNGDTVMAGRKKYDPVFSQKVHDYYEESGDRKKTAEHFKITEGKVVYLFKKVKAAMGEPVPTRKYNKKTKLKPKRAKDSAMQVITASPAQDENIIVIVTKPSGLRAVLGQLSHE